MFCSFPSKKIFPFYPKNEKITIAHHLCSLESGLPFELFLYMMVFQVFNYEGHYLRQIGGEGITNYPIGVGINSQGEVVVADNHNNFNLTIFSQVSNPI